MKFDANLLNRHYLSSRKFALDFPELKYCLLIVMLTFFSIGTAYSQTILKTSKWQAIDLPFNLEEAVEKPFQLELSCVFAAPDGTTITVPGFYNGQKEWLVRFNPNQTGSWQAVSQSGVRQLNGINYTIEVAPAKPGHHGGVRVSGENPQKLYYEDGTPYNLVANEVDWLFALDYGDPDLPKTKKMVEALASNGFNQIIMNVYAYDLDWKQSENIDPKWDFGSKKKIFPFLGDNENPDYSALNINFFKHYDRVIDLLEDNGIIAHIMIYVWNKKVNWPEADSAADNMYFDYVVKRYQAKSNVLWDISKEALRYGHDDLEYITKRIDRLRELDVYDRLVTVHDYDYCAAHPEKVDIISAQFWYTDIYSDMLKMKKQYPNKPIINLENGGYEKCQYDIFLDANYDHPRSCVERNYKCAFAGTYTSYYWQGSAWNIVIWDPFAEDVTVQPKFECYKYMREFLDKVHFDKLKPNNRHCSSGYCLANDEDGQYVYYVPKDNSAIAVKGLPKAEKLQIQWFNPLTGEYKEPDEVKYKGWLVLNPEFEGIDNVLIVTLIDRVNAPDTTASIYQPLELNLEPERGQHGTRMKLALIPAGSFVMGCAADEIGRDEDEGPQRKVTLSRAFYMGIYEVTQEQYQVVMGNNPSHFRGLKNPVENLTWDEVMAFCRKLSVITKMKITLPTEAQWEYACRAGTQSRYHFGNDTGNLDAYAWHMRNGGDKTHPVGQKKPNAFGLYDMHGNAWEWCLDWYQKDYEGLANTDPVGTTKSTYRVVRGGSFHFIDGSCRSADRDLGAPGPDYKYNYLGFRVVAVP